jgi:pyruvate,water dikinase
MNVVWLDEPTTPELVGSKGYRLSVMARSGLPVPGGFCIPIDFIKTITPGNIESELAKLPSTSVAVRSSACDEDGVEFSFAGIYKSILNVTGGQQVWNAVQEIQHSAESPAAQAYRRRLGIAKSPAMAAVIQSLLPSVAAGVLFMQDPVDRSDHIVVEGSWGLGESVVSGSVTPDRWTLSQDGKLLASEVSNKETSAIPGQSGTVQIEVPEDRRLIPCLTAENLEEIVTLARRCQQLFERPQDLEWAVAGGKVWLLQSRPITGTQRRISRLS